MVPAAIRRQCLPEIHAALSPNKKTIALAVSPARPIFFIGWRFWGAAFFFTAY
jgi:hypothetical protein